MKPIRLYPRNGFSISAVRPLQKSWHTFIPHNRILAKSLPFPLITIQHINSILWFDTSVFRWKSFKSHITCIDWIFIIIYLFWYLFAMIDLHILELHFGDSFEEVGDLAIEAFYWNICCLLMELFLNLVIYFWIL